MAAPIRLLAERSRVFLDYGQGEDHERIILDHVDACEYVVASPTFDIFVKQLDATNPDIEGIRYEIVPGQLPLGLDPNRVFGFRALTPVELDTLVGEGKLLGRSERLARGLGVAAGLGAAPIPAAAAVVPIAAPAPPAVPAAAVVAVAAAPHAGGVPLPVPGLVAPPVPARPAAAGGQWVLDEVTVNFDIGDTLVLPAGAAVLGDCALVQVGGDIVKARFLAAGTDLNEYAVERKAFLADDLRVLAPARAIRGFIDAVKEMTGPRQVLRPTPLAGVDSKNWFLDAFLRSGQGSMVSRHFHWKSSSGCKVVRMIHEHEVLSRIIEILATVDGVNLRQSEAAELTLRRLQLIEESVSENPDEPSMEGAEHYMGVGEQRGGALVSPGLRAYVARELSKQAAVLKEKRKAREAKGGGKARGN